MKKRGDGHNKYCVECDEEIETGLDHVLAPYDTATCTASGTKGVQCTVGCGYETSEASPAKGHIDSDNNGLCDTCGINMSQSHTCTADINAGWQSDETSHWYKCTDPTCTKKVGEVQHTWGDPKNPGEKLGICTICGEDCQHEGDVSYEIVEGVNYHNVICKICNDRKTTEDHAYDQDSYTNIEDNPLKHMKVCYKCGDETEEFHNYGDDNICDDCGDEFDGVDNTHSLHSTEPKPVDTEYHREYCNTCDVYFGELEPHNPAVSTFEESGHTLYCKDGCSVVLGSEPHTLVTVPTSPCTKKCSATDCGYVEANHSFTVFVKNLTPATCTQNGTAEWKCAYCNETTVKTVTAAHKFVAFTNPATCTAAGSTGEKCSVCGATRNVTAINALGHNVTSYTNSNDGFHTGTCTRCNQPVKEAHKYNSSNVCTVCGAVKNTTCNHNYQIKTDLTTQTSHYKVCTLCNDIITENHTFNNGVCSVCNYNCVHTYEDKKDNSYHWKECSNCGVITNKESHEYKDGECECGKEDPNPTCQHELTEWAKNTTYHWKKCQSCGREIDGTREKHTYVNGVCICGAKKNNNGEEECKHTSTEWNMSNIEHWKVCKDCSEEIEGTRAKHTYENGVCKCGKKENEKICEHKNREWKFDGNEHWQICKDCGKEIEGTRTKHNYVDGECKNCGTKDPTGSGNKIPNTGNKTIIIAATILGTLTVVGAIKLKRYKGV